MYLVQSNETKKNNLYTISNPLGLLGGSPRNSVTVDDREIYMRTFLADNLIFNILFQTSFFP